MSEATGSAAGDTGEGGSATPAPEDSEAPKITAKPISDETWKRSRSKSENALAAIIETSKRDRAEAKGDYESKSAPTPPDKAITRPAETGKEEIGLDGRARDASGRFVAAETGEAPAQGKEAPSKPDATPAAAAPKVKFAGQEWDDLSAAEKAYAERDWHLARAVESANAWKAEAERRAQAQGTPVAAPEPSKSATPTTVEATGIDKEMVEEVWKAANEAGRPELYAQWLAEENQRIFDAKLEARFAELAKPQQEAQERAQLQTEIVSNWRGLSQYTKRDGSPAFPEIGNQAAESQIGEYWLALGFPPELMRTPTAMMAGIALYRMMNEEPPPIASATAQALAPPSAPNTDFVTTGSPSRIDPTEEPMSAESRYLQNALSRSGVTTKDANGKVTRLWSR